MTIKRDPCMMDSVSHEGIVEEELYVTTKWSKSD